MIQSRKWNVTAHAYEAVATPEFSYRKYIQSGTLFTFSIIVNFLIAV